MKGKDMSLKGRLLNAGISHFAWNVHEYPAGKWCWSAAVAYKRARLPIAAGDNEASADRAKKAAIQAIEEWEKENV